MQTASLIAHPMLSRLYDFKEEAHLLLYLNAKSPCFLFMEQQMTFIPYSMMNELCEAKPGINKQMLTAKGATHANSLYLLGESYWDTVFDFINKYIK